MCAVVIAPAHLAEVRQALIALRMPGQRRLHMDHERDRRRRLILDRIARLPVRAHVYQQPGKPIQARIACLRAMTADLLRVGVTRLVIEPIDGMERRDHGAIIDELRAQRRPGALSYEHTVARLEANLWAADAIAWAYGAGRDWRRRIWHLLDVRPGPIRPGQRETRAPTVR